MAQAAWRRIVVAFGLGAGAICAACSVKSSSMDGNSPAGTYSFCEALAPSCNAMYSSTPTPCTRASAAQCSRYQSTFSQAFQDAVVQCAAEASPCTASFSACWKHELGRGPRTAVQEKVRNDLCAVCPNDERDNLGACAAFFEVSEAEVDAGPGLKGSGYSVLLVNDEIAKEIGDACIAKLAPHSDGGGACDLFAFLTCAKTVRENRTTPPECHVDVR